MASLAMWVDSTRTTLGSPLGLTMRLRYEQGDLPLVPDLSTLVEEAVVDPLSVSELVDGAEKRANDLGVFFVFAAQTAGWPNRRRWDCSLSESAVSGGRL